MFPGIEISGFERSISTFLKHRNTYTDDFVCSQHTDEN